MVTKYVDLTDNANTDDLSRIVAEVEGTGETVILRRDGRPVVHITPPTDATMARSRPQRRVLNEEEREKLLSLAGAWADIVDFDEWDRARAAQRAMPPGGASS